MKEVSGISMLLWLCINTLCHCFGERGGKEELRPQATTYVYGVPNHIERFMGVDTEKPC